MTTVKSNGKLELDFEVSRDEAPPFWMRLSWYYIKPLNEKARAFLLEDFNPDYHVWDDKRDALQLDPRDIEELMEFIDRSEFNGNWRKGGSEQ